MRLASVMLLAALALPAIADQKAPDFALPNLDGVTVRLSSLLGKGPVLVTFWSTWCANCPQELKQFDRLYKAYKDRGFAVLAIAVDGTKTVAKVKPFVQGRRLSFYVLLDTNNDVMRLYQITSVPTSLLLDSAGVVRHTHVGYHDGDEVTIESEIKALLGDSR